MTAGLSDHARVAMLEREAAFGLSEIERIVATCCDARKNLVCLEVGSSLGFLLQALRSRFPDHAFEGIEPVAIEAGFSRTVDAAKLVRRDPTTTIHACGYEDFVPTRAYDLVFSMNVMEHLSSWQRYLLTTHRWLAPGGVSVVLCPNYAFPWESHFHLPIVFGKSFSGRMLARQIAAFERREGCPGLWDGLNFVTKSGVTRFLSTQGISFRWDETIMSRMVEGVFKDADFAQRHGIFGRLARLASRAGLTAAVERPPLNRFAPYMQLIVVKA